MECCGEDTYCYMEYPQAGLLIGKICILLTLIFGLLDLLTIVFFDELMETEGIDNEAIKKNPDAVYMFAGFSLTAFILSLTVTILMIIGIHKKSCVLLLPWLIFTVIAMLVIVVSTFISSTAAAAFRLVLLGFLIWAWYGIAVVFNHFHYDSTL